MTWILELPVRDFKVTIINIVKGDNGKRQMVHPNRQTISAKMEIRGKKSNGHKHNMKRFLTGLSVNWSQLMKTPIKLKVTLTEIF